MSEPCVLCAAKDQQIDRLLSRRDTIDHARAKARVVELEETLVRVQQSQPQRLAVEVCRELALTDPRDMESLKCLWCAAETVRGDQVKHRPDCTFIQAQIVADRAAKDDTRRVVDRWRTG